MGGAVPFPLPEKFFPSVRLSAQEEDAFRAKCQELLRKTLEQEIDYRTRAGGRLDDAKWKFVKAKDGLRVFKRLPAAPHVHVVGQPSASPSASPTMGLDQPLPPMVVAVGKIPGSLEDALYGLHNKTTQEMRIMTSFLNKSVRDAAVFHTIDRGSDADPFRSLAVKWRIAETPGGNLISNRDVVVLEASGCGVDRRGERYGYHLIKSINAPWFPALPDPHVVRARMMMCCVYRQTQPDVVDTYIKGVFDLGGDLIDVLAYNTAADKVLGISKAVVCAEAKRLTLRMILEQRRRLQSFRPGHKSLSTKEVVMVDRFATSTTTCDDDDDPSNAFHALDGAHNDGRACSLCLRPRNLVSRLGAAWDRCRICTSAVCPKCFVRKTIFAQPRHIKVACCKACIVEARDLHVDPRDPYPVIGHMTHHD